MTPEQWYEGLLNRLAQRLDLEEELEEAWDKQTRFGPLQRWQTALQTVILRKIPGRIVIFVDEIDVVRSLPFPADEFFAAIRQCYVGRATDPELLRLSFCLLGVATPSDLIRDTRVTPFNIGRRIEVTDFTPAEAAPLAKGLGSGGERLLACILSWTNGHPYLTQRLCRVVVEAGVKTIRAVDTICAELFLTHKAQESDDNLTFVRDRLLRSEADLASLLELYRQVQSGKRLFYDETNPLCSVLRLSGVARVAAGQMQVRNRIYQQVFDRKWIAKHMPDAELQRQNAARRRGFRQAALLFGAIAGVVGALGWAAAWTAKKNADLAYQLNQTNGKLSKALDNARMATVLADNRAQENGRLAKTNADLARKRQAALADRKKALDNALKQQGMAETSAHKEKLAAAAARKAEAYSTKETVRANRYLYIANMNLAQQAWEATPIQVGRVLELLAETKDNQDRGFEWGYWNRLCQLDLLTLGGHTGYVTSVAFSPDGRRIVTGSYDYNAKVWDSLTGQELLRRIEKNETKTWLISPMSILGE